MDLSSCGGGGGGLPQLHPQYGLYQVAGPPPLGPPAVRAAVLHQAESALKMGLYPGLVMPTIYPHQTLMMSPNIPAITPHHLPPPTTNNNIKLSSLFTNSLAGLDFFPFLQAGRTLAPVVPYGGRQNKVDYTYKDFSFGRMLSLFLLCYFVNK